MPISKIGTNGLDQTDLDLGLTGNVGIGTSTPTAKLEVIGEIRSTNGTEEVIVSGSNGSIEIVRTAGNPFIDFKSAIAEDFDCRIQQDSNGLAFSTGGNGAAPERMRIASDGKVTFQQSIDARTTNDAAGYGIRVRQGSGGQSAIIQYTDNAATTEWGSLLAQQANVLIFRTGIGNNSTVANNYGEFNLYGGHTCIRAVTNANGDIGDWPTPVLGLSGWDSNFDYKTMLIFGLRDDASMYQTGSSVWNFRLYQGSVGQVTSNSNTALQLVGPGPLRMQAGASNGVQLTNGATSWTSWSDERMKDIIEPIEGAIGKVKTLRTVIGKFKTEEEGIRRPFLIAQDVQKVFPEAVTESILVDEVDKEDIYKKLGKQERLLLSYTDLIPLLTAAIKEQQETIESLKARIEALENK